MIPEKDVKGFLAELTNLTHKYNISLWACNCCEGINMEIPKGIGKYSYHKNTFQEVAHGITWDEIEYEVQK